VTAVCILVVIAAGALAAVMIEREGERPMPQRMLTVASAVGVMALGSVVLAALSGGPAGPGTLRAFGPSPWQVGLSTGFELGVVASVVILGRHWVQIARDLLRS
jgi:hypothetical protein